LSHVILMDQYRFQDKYQGNITKDTETHTSRKINSDISSTNTNTTDEFSFDDTDKILIGTNVAMLLLKLKNQIKIYHWQTKLYSEHIALDNLFAKLTKKNDEWVEVFQGKYGRIRLDGSNQSIHLDNLNSTKTNDYLSDIASKIVGLRDKYFNESVNSDLSNIFDEIIGYLYRAKYLLSLTN
jgi:hypothetical protein